MLARFPEHLQGSHSEYWPLDKSWIVRIAALTRTRTTLIMMTPGSGPGRAHDVSTHEILTVFTDPRLAKHGSYWELWLASCLMTIVMAGICDWSVTSHTGLWLADNVPMYHCTSHYPCLSLVSYPSPEHADCIHRYRLGTGTAETVVMLVLPSHCSSHQGEPGRVWQNHFRASQKSFLNLTLTQYKIQFDIGW